MSEHIGKICPACQAELKEGESIITCPSCGIPHHEGCWNANHGCTTFGCDQQNVVAAPAAPAAPVAPAEPVAYTQPAVPAAPAYAQPAAPAEPAYAQPAAPAYAQSAYVQPTAPAAPAEVCTACGTPFGEGQNFCTKCGAPKPVSRPNTCTNCGNTLQPGQAFCNVCGQQVQPAGVSPAINQYNAQVTQPKKNLKMWLIIAAAAVAAIILIFILIPKDGVKDVLPDVVLSVEDLCAKGSYEEAYEKASGTEKDAVLAENVAAVMSYEASEKLKDPDSFKLREAYYRPYIDDEDGHLGGYMVLYSSGTNSYGATVSSYMAFVWSQEDRKWEYWGSCKTTQSESSDDTSDTLVKIVVELSLEKGIELDKDSVKNINKMFEEGTLEDVELIDRNIIETTRFDTI